MPSDQLSAHFTLAELTQTNTGLDNAPNKEQADELARLAETILEPMRAMLGPLSVNSGFRTPAVNATIHGAKNSQHMKGQAADLWPLKVRLEFAFQAIKATEIPFDQLIIEPAWIHVSVSALGAKPRRQTLRMHVVDGSPVYDPA